MELQTVVDFFVWYPGLAYICLISGVVFLYTTFCIVELLRSK